MSTRDLGFPSQSISEVLHFLQREWSTFSQDRAQWQYERAMLKQRINVLEGETNGLRKHNRDLLRRCKMLEMVLTNERAKARGDEPEGENKLKEAAKSLPERKPLKAKLAKVREGRMILQTYLKEVGITANLLSVQAARFESEYPSFSTLLDHDHDHHNTSDDSYMSTDSPPTELTDNTQKLRKLRSKKKLIGSDVLVSGEEKPLAMFPLLESEEDDNGNEGEGDSSDEPDIRMPNDDDGNDNVDSGEVVDSEEDDLDRDGRAQEDAAEDMLSSLDELLERVQGEDAATSSDEMKPPGTDSHSPDEEGSGDNITDSSAKNAQEDNDKDAKDDGNNEEQEEEEDDDPYKNIDDAALQASIAKRFGSKGIKMLKKSKGKKRDMRNLFGMDNSNDLGELANVSVENKPIVDETSLAPIGDTSTSSTSVSDEKTNTLSVRRDWALKLVLKGHLKGVRCVDVHDVFNLIVTGSEDKTIKVWWFPDVNKTTKPQYDVAPIATLRGHTGAVTSVCISSDGTHCYSSSEDGTIRSWQIPQEDFPIFSPYSSHQEFVIEAHFASIVSLCLDEEKSRLLSCSVDGTCCLWDIASQKKVANRSFEGDASPTTAHILLHSPQKAAIATSNSLIHIVDITTLSTLSSIDLSEKVTGGALCLASQSSSPVLAGGFGDHTVRMFDTESGEETSNISAHLSPTTSLHFSDNHILVSTGSDRKIRCWNVDTLSCIWDKAAHRLGANGGVLGSAFRIDGTLIVSVGAEGEARVYVQS
eukprot:m.75740 g.75740  ORF g.75740 m.75740 type:complete len:759 (+) comp11852_c0_seq1:77-2353(+)